MNNENQHSFTGFRLPDSLLTQVNFICLQNDLNRSQFLRRCVIEYLKCHLDHSDKEPKLKWSAHLYDRIH